MRNAYKNLSENLRGKRHVFVWPQAWVIFKEKLHVTLSKDVQKVL